jgi:hypothetical protein
MYTESFAGDFRYAIAYCIPNHNAKVKFLLDVNIRLYALAFISLLKCKRYLMQSFELGVYSLYEKLNIISFRASN